MGVGKKEGADRISRGPPTEMNTKKQPLVWASLTVPCPWASDGPGGQIPKLTQKTTIVGGPLTVPCSWASGGPGGPIPK